MKHKLSITCSPRFFWHLIDRMLTWKSKNLGGGGVAIIRIGGIGDTLLTIPLLLGLKSTKNKITLICSDRNLCIDFILRKYADEIIYYNNKRMKIDLKYRMNMLRSLRSKGYETVIQSGISRQQGGADVIAWACSAKKTIGFYPRKWNRCEIELSNKWFSHLIDGKYGEMHEIQRMDIIAQSLGCMASEFQLPHSNQTENIFVVCVDTSSSVREWSIDNFIDLAIRLEKETKLIPVFVGENESKSKKLSSFSFPHKNLIGKTTFEELHDIISRSKFIITNDSAPMHLGIYLNIPTVAIVSGGEYNSYINYPNKHANNYLPITTKDRLCFNCGWNCIYKKNDGNNFPCLSSITVDDVFSCAVNFKPINELMDCKA
ncbi:glycosyltransferase family 9 protein [Acidithiobacillus sp. VAN18-1]|uniref:Glycosyltransferase family 9 protein n=1 Tax=Igneacidithiobacillus copahuensis TaxID=2724909 RepID=A0AAE3CK40_9PROT|nr:glycosyltransferase family 9 protein [Igneacidithiobacillus copahuensis]MBU2788060.1 glycosyltransferase family 9 protein [Igneacidithiobacillus copahuensis]MBU2795371.1 glycosyltransferase family 9 protein [Acidithiobacillus sp. VAN18-2]